MARFLAKNPPESPCSLTKHELCVLCLDRVSHNISAAALDVSWLPTLLNQLRVDMRISVSLYGSGPS